MDLVHYPTFWKQKFQAGLLTPARRLDVPGVCIHPEVVALWVAIEVQPYPVALHLRKRMKAKADRENGLKHLKVIL